MKSARGLVVLIILVAGVLGWGRNLTRRSAAFKGRAIFHYRLEQKYHSENNEVKRLYHSLMSAKYFIAAARPWFFVPSDPPEPQTWREFSPALDRMELDSR